MRPRFAPFAIAATALLAANNLLLGLELWPMAHVIFPVVALALLGLAVTLWWRGA